MKEPHVEGLSAAIGPAVSASSRHRLPLRPAMDAGPERHPFARRPSPSNRRHESAVGQITITRQQSIDRDVFVQRFPVNTAWAELEMGALRRRGSQQSREPSQRYSHDSAVV